MVVIIITYANTVVIAMASGQQLFYLLLESGLKGRGVPGRVVMLANRRCWLVNHECEGKGSGKRVIPATSPVGEGDRKGALSGPEWMHSRKSGDSHPEFRSTTTSLCDLGPVTPPLKTSGSPVVK